MSIHESSLAALRLSRPTETLRPVRWPSAPTSRHVFGQLRVRRPHHEVAALDGVRQLGGQLLELPLPRLEPAEDRLGHVAELVAAGLPVALEALVLLAQQLAADGVGGVA